MSLDFGSPDSRRIPVYFLVGTGASMAGRPIQAVEAGLKALHKELLGMPDAVEQVWISLITFDSTARQVLPLTSLEQVSFPALSAGGGVHLGQGLELLLFSLQRDIRVGSALEKKDFRPLVFLFFDNQPDDRWEKHLEGLEKARAEGRLGSLIAIGLGGQVNLAVLHQLTDSVLSMPEFDPELLLSVFRWTSSSVTTVSRSVAKVTGDQVVQLPKPPDGVKVSM